MSEIKSVGEVISEIAANKEYENGAIAQWYKKLKTR